MRKSFVSVGIARFGQSQREGDEAIYIVKVIQVILESNFIDKLRYKNIPTIVLNSYRYKIKLYNKTI